MLIGNSFVYFQFQGKDHIDSSTRNIVFTVLISVAIVGVIFFGIMRRVNQPFEESTRDRELEDRSNSNSIIGAFVQAIRLFFTRNMLLLCITFLYTGKNKYALYLYHLVKWTTLLAVIECFNRNLSYHQSIWHQWNSLNFTKKKIWFFSRLWAIIL